MILLNDTKIETKTVLSFGDRIFIGNLQIIKQTSTTFYNEENNEEKPYFLFQVSIFHYYLRSVTIHNNVFSATILIQPRQTNPDAFLQSDTEKLEQEKRRDKQDQKLQELMINFETKIHPNLLLNLGQNALVN